MPTKENTIEARVPAADRWVAQVLDVPERAKSMRDWDTAFLRAGQLLDLEPGILVAAAESAGSRRYPKDLVTLQVLLPDGEWYTLTATEGKEWAFGMRETAREWLSVSHETRIRRALESSRARWRGALSVRQEGLESLRDVDLSAGQVRVFDPADDGKVYASRPEEIAALIAQTEVKLAEAAKMIEKREAQIAALDPPAAPDPSNGMMARSERLEALIDKYRDNPEVLAIVRALGVIVMSPGIRADLIVHDPQALAQADRAIAG